MSKYLHHSKEVRHNMTQVWETLSERHRSIDIAYKMGVDAAEFCRVVHQKANLSTDFIIKFCEVTKTPVSLISIDLNNSLIKIIGGVK